MKLAELFVNLGVKGTDATQNALGGVKKSMGEISSLSLEAKAAIVGVVYGLERLMSGAGEMGTSLSNFNALTGLSTKALQQWQYAAVQGGSSADEMASSLKAVQQTMSDVIFKRKQVEGMGPLMAKTGFDPSKSQDPFYVMSKLQELSTKYSAPIANSLIKSFGVSDGVIAAMRKGVFNENTFKHAPVLSDGQVNSLNKMDVAMTNLGQKIKMAMAGFSSKHGQELVKGLSDITEQVLRLVGALTELAERLKVFQLISKAVSGITAAVQLSRAVEALMSGDTKEQKKIQKELETPEAKDNLKDLIEAHKTAVKSYNSGESPKGLFQFLKEMVSPETPGLPQKDMIAPKTPSNVPPQSSNGSNVEFNQTFNFQHDGKNAQQVGQNVQQGVMNAFRQSPVQLQRI